METLTGPSFVAVVSAWTTAMSWPPGERTQKLRSAFKVVKGRVEVGRVSMPLRQLGRVRGPAGGM